MAKDKYILFLGDSFTWGQGLYLPSWVERKPEVFHNFLEVRKGSAIDISMQWTDQMNYIDKEDLRIKDELSFTGIVGRELNRIPLKKYSNGGSISNNLINLRDRHVVNGNEIDLYDSYRKYDVIIVFQFSSIGREDFEGLTKEESDLIIDTQKSFSDVLGGRIKTLYDKVDNVFKEVERKYGYKYLYMDWLGNI